MKLASEIAKINSDDRIVHWLASSRGYIPVDPAKLASEIKCPFCGTAEFYTHVLENKQVAWICGRICSLSRLPNYDQATTTPPKPQRSILWALFCEFNGIGDEYHNVTFEAIDQSSGKIDYLKKFGDNPRGLVLMQGPSGTGKTYAAMGLCEYFTRSRTDCKFMSYRHLKERWIQSFKEEYSSVFMHTLKEISLLVVDDFGTGEPTKTFMEFFMDLVDFRLQWKTKGTVITTNLTDDKMSLVCGEHLSDRLKTGQLLQFAGSSRRKLTPL
jgi:hypothetical protein